MTGRDSDPTADCTLMTHSAPDGCDWCGADLPPRHTRWCRGLCTRAYEDNHNFKMGRARTKRKARISKGVYKCDICKQAVTDINVDHIVPCIGKHKAFGCWHHLDNLRVLCVPCHKVVTREQHAAGVLRQP